MNKTILITHKDLDGVASAMIVKAALQDRLDDPIYDIAYGKRESVFDLVFERMGKDKKLQLIITDIAVDNGMDIDVEMEKFKDRIWWIDHHDTNKYIHKVKHKIWDTKKSAALLTYEAFSKQYNIKHLWELTKYANDYDMWIHKYKKSWAMSDIYYYYWTKKFMMRFYHGNLALMDGEMEYLQKINDKRKEIWIKAKKEMMINTNKYGKYAVVFIPRYADVNFVCEKIKRMKIDDLEFTIAIPSSNKISIRTVSGVNLIERLKDFKIGGHPGACGIVVDITDKSDPFVKEFFLCKKK